MQNGHTGTREAICEAVADIYGWNTYVQKTHI